MRGVYEKIKGKEKEKQQSHHHEWRGEGAINDGECLLPKKRGERIMSSYF